MRSKMSIKDLYKRYQAFILVTASNLVILAGILIFFRPSFDADCDYLMQVLLYGKWEMGISLNRLVFSNAILGRILNFAVSKATALPWYAIFHYVCAFGAISLTGLTITHRSDIYAGWLVSLPVMAFLGFECYGSPVYVKTAAVLIFSACLAIVTQMTKERCDIRYLVTGAVFIAVAGLITKHSLIYYGATAAVSVIVYILYKRKTLVPKSVIVVVVVLALSSIPVFAENAYDDHLYKDELMYLTTSMYRDDFEKIVTFGSEDFDYKNEMLVYVTEALYSRGVLVPEMAYMYDRLKEITAVRLELNVEEIANFFAIGLGEALSIETVCIALFYVFILFRQKRRGRKLLTPASALTYVVLLFILRLNYAAGYPWMFTILLLPPLLILLFGAEGISGEHRREYAAYAVAVGVLLIMHYSGVLSTEVNTERGAFMHYGG